MASDSFETKTGLAVRVRPIQPDDAPYLVAIFEHMSSESRYRRFHQPVDNVGEARVWTEAERIAQADPETAEGLIAFADLPNEPNAPVAAARYVRLEPTVAEAAISVRDDLQNIGIGTRLLQLLAEEAREAGVHKLVAVVQNSNKPIWRILEHLSFAVKREPQGAVSEVEIDLLSLKAQEVAR
ncbi:MAG TPA: GNAT family N-acetyltransferase [Anaerolineae bacterium]